MKQSEEIEREITRIKRAIRRDGYLFWAFLLAVLMTYVLGLLGVFR